MLEWIAEQLEEDYGDTEGRQELITSPRPVRGILEAALRRIIARYVNVWACEEVARRTYDAVEIEDHLREYCPEWFEEEQP